jgi:hypothetical protein
MFWELKGSPVDFAPPPQPLEDLELEAPLPGLDQRPTGAFERQVSVGGGSHQQARLSGMAELVYLEHVPVVDHRHHQSG